MAGQLVIRQEDGYLPPPLHLSSASKAAPSGCSRGCCNAPGMRTPPPSDPCKTPNKTRQGSSPRPHPPATTNTIMRWTGGTRSLRVSARSLVPDHTHTHTHTHFFYPFRPPKKNSNRGGKVGRTLQEGRPNPAQDDDTSPTRPHHQRTEESRPLPRTRTLGALGYGACRPLRAFTRRWEESPETKTNQGPLSTRRTRPPPVCLGGCAPPFSIHSRTSVCVCRTGEEQGTRRKTKRGRLSSRLRFRRLQFRRARTRKKTGATAKLGYRSRTLFFHKREASLRRPGVGARHRKQ